MMRLYAAQPPDELGLIALGYIVIAIVAAVIVAKNWTRHG